MPDDVDDQAPWLERAACKDADPELFLVGNGTNKNIQPQVLEAKRYCGMCAVRLECLNLALATDDRHNVMGNMTPAERRSYQRRQARVAR